MRAAHAPSPHSSAAEGREVALAVVLPHVDRQVGDPLGVLAVVCERTRSQRPARHREDVVHRAGHHGTHPQGAQAGRGQVDGIEVDLPGGVAEGGSGGVQGDVDRTDGGREQRVGTTAGGRRMQPGRDGPGATGPHRRHSDAPVPEAGPLDVGTGAAHRRRGNRVEEHVGGVAGHHAGPGPDGGVGRDAAVGQPGEEQPGTVVGVRGDQRVGQGARPRAPGLAAVQEPAAVHLPRHQACGRRLGGPHAQPVVGRDPGAAELGEHGHGIGVPLREPGQRQIRRAQCGQ